MDLNSEILKVLNPTYYKILKYLKNLPKEFIYDLEFYFEYVIKNYYTDLLINMVSNGKLESKIIMLLKKYNYKILKNILKKNDCYLLNCILENCTQNIQISIFKYINKSNILKEKYLHLLSPRSFLNLSCLSKQCPEITTSIYNLPESSINLIIEKILTLRLHNTLTNQDEVDYFDGYLIINKHVDWSKIKEDLIIEWLRKQKELITNNKSIELLRYYVRNISLLEYNKSFMNVSEKVKNFIFNNFNNIEYRTLCTCYEYHYDNEYTISLIIFTDIDKLIENFNENRKNTILRYYVENLQDEDMLLNTFKKFINFVDCYYFKTLNNKFRGTFNSNREINCIKLLHYLFTDEVLINKLEYGIFSCSTNPNIKTLDYSLLIKLQECVNIDFKRCDEKFTIKFKEEIDILIDEKYNKYINLLNEIFDYSQYPEIHEKIRSYF